MGLGDFGFSSLCLQGKEDEDSRSKHRELQSNFKTATYKIGIWKLVTIGELVLGNSV